MTWEPKNKLDDEDVDVSDDDTDKDKDDDKHGEDTYGEMVGVMNGPPFARARVGGCGGYKS